MVHSPDKHLNLRADIKATYQSLGARIQVGGNWRGAASVARELAEKLEQLAEMDDSQSPRVRFQTPPTPPSSGAEWLGAGKYDETPRPRRNRRRIQVTEVKREPPELPPG